MTKKEFWIRAILWGLFACVGPVLFIGFRYDLFKGENSSLRLSGWGLFAIVILIVFIYVLVKYINAGIVEHSMVKQVVMGIIKVLLPLIAIFAVIWCIRKNIDYFLQALGAVIICEAIAIPINPFPKWVYEKSKGRFTSTVDYLNEVFSRKENND